jgi:predicted MPP superfamily phosphohydrolase
VLNRLRLLHDLLIVALPALFIWFAGIHGLQLFVSAANWYLLPVPVLAYLVVCGSVASTLPFIGLWRFQYAPAQRISNSSKTVDVAAILGFRPVGRGPGRILTHLPGNEFLKLSVSEQEYRLPRLPMEWDGLSILHLSDLHFIGTVDRPYFEKVIQIAAEMHADLVAFTGDLLDRGDLVEWLPSTLGKLKAPLGCYFVLGNHDSYLQNTEQIRDRLQILGWRDAAGRLSVIDHCGRKLAVCGTERPWMGRQPDLSALAGETFKVCLSHTPDNIGWARRQGIDVLLAGHNHGGQVRLPLFGAVYSPSIYGAHFAAGAFWKPPTLLYVSRGISGKYPLRWNCLPELTRLVLRPALSGENESTAVGAQAAPAHQTIS